MGLIQHDGVLIKRGNLNTQTDRERRLHEETQEEDRHLSAKESGWERCLPGPQMEPAR